MTGLTNAPVTLRWISVLERAPFAIVLAWLWLVICTCRHGDCAAVKARSKRHSFCTGKLLGGLLALIQIPQLCLRELHMWIAEEGTDGVEQALLSVRDLVAELLTGLVVDDTA